MLDKPLETIDEATLNLLVTNKATEGRHLEFKSELPNREGDAIREFLADVSAFSNSQGGHLLFGVTEAAGAATGVPGVTVDDPDAELLRLENLIRDGMDPRLIGVRLRWVPLASGTSVLVIRVAAGVTAPHRIVYRNSGKFFARNSAGKYEMDVHELRHAFTEAENVPRRFRQLHAEAIERAQGVDMPVSMVKAPTAVASFIPLSIFREERDLPLNFDRSARPPARYGYNTFEMIEGFVTCSTTSDPLGATDGLAVTHRNGRVDCSWSVSRVVDIDPKTHQSLIWHQNFENGLWDAVSTSQSCLQSFGIEGPWIIFASIYGAKGFQMHLGDWHSTRAAYRDDVLLGELRLEDVSSEGILPIVKRFWLLFGVSRPDNLPFPPSSK